MSGGLQALFFSGDAAFGDAELSINAFSRKNTKSIHQISKCDARCHDIVK